MNTIKIEKIINILYGGINWIKDILTELQFLGIKKNDLLIFLDLYLKWKSDKWMNCNINGKLQNFKFNLLFCLLIKLININDFSICLCNKSFSYFRFELNHEIE